MGRPFLTGRINLTPEAERQLNEIDDWIAKNATADTARRFVSAILEHSEGILVFPLAGRARDDVRPGMRTTTYKKRTLVAYEVVASARGQHPRRLPRRPELGGPAQRQGGLGGGLTSWLRGWQKRGRRATGARRPPTPSITFPQVSHIVPSATTNSR